MADIELVIKLPEEMYEIACNLGISYFVTGMRSGKMLLSNFAYAIKNGTPHDTHGKTCMNCFHNYGVRHNTEFNPEDIVCEYWESDGLTKEDFCSRWKDKESEE